MRFCTECGNELVEDTRFCVRCGHKVTKKETGGPDKALIKPTDTEFIKDDVDEYEETKEKRKEENESAITAPSAAAIHNEQEVDTPSVEQPIEQKAKATPPVKEIRKQKRTKLADEQEKKSSLWRNVVIGLIIVLIVVLFGLHKWLENHFDPMKDLIAMDEAVAKKDLDGYMKYIHFDEDVLLDEESYFEIIEETEWRESIKDQYFEIVETLKETGSLLDREIYDQYDEPMYRIEKENILFGLYHKLSLSAVPIELEIRADLFDTEVNFAEETFTLTDEEKEVTIEVYPGIYEMDAKSKQKYGTFTYDLAALIDSRENNFIDISFAQGYYAVDYSSDYDDAILFIDGESTEEKLSEIDELGPIPSDSDLKLYAVWQDKDNHDIVSNTIQLNSDYPTSTLYFQFDDRYKMSLKNIDNEEVGQFVLGFRDAYEDAVNYLEYDYIKDYLKKGSDAAKGLEDFIEDMKSGFYYYNFTENTVLNVKEKDDGKYEVKTNEKFEFQDDDFRWYDYDREKKYHVELEDDKLKITKIDYLDTKKERR